MLTICEKRRLLLTKAVESESVCASWPGWWVLASTSRREGGEGLQYYRVFSPYTLFKIKLHQSKSHNLSTYMSSLQYMA